MLRSVGNAPCYVKNNTLHRDLQMKTVDEQIKTLASQQTQRLET